MIHDTGQRPHARRTDSTAKSVSVIIPAYNAEATISQTLNSLLQQTHQEWEAIVVDDGSNDRTAKIAEDFAARDERIRMIRQAQAGEAGARNTGISVAQSAWLLFLDADDWISSSHMERMIQKLVSDPNLDAAICRSVRVAADGTQTLEPFFPLPGDLFPILARRAAFNVHACIVRKSVVDEVGRFDSSLQRLPDWDLWQKIARSGAQFGIIDEVLAFYRMRPNSVSLDVPILFRDGLTILRRGHNVDPRVSKPLPKYESGMPREKLPAEEIYFLSWCAGIALGQKNDPTWLLESLKCNDRVEVYPNAIADCIFYAALLPGCQPPDQWETLAPRILPDVDHFLHALEQKATRVGIANRCGIELRKMILRNSPLWRTVMEDAENTVSAMEQLRKVADENRNRWENTAKEREQWRVHWEKLSQQKDLELTKWEQLADERAKWRIHWEKVAGEIEREREHWKQIAAEREEWFKHWKTVAEQTEKERDEWQRIAADREKWLKHWQEVAGQTEKYRNEWQQTAEERERWLLHWQSIAEQLENEKLLLQKKSEEQQQEITSHETPTAADSEIADPQHTSEDTPV